MAQITLADNLNLTWNLSTDFSAKLTASSGIGDNRFLNNAVLAAAISGEAYQLIFKQDAIGGRYISFGQDFTVFGQFNLNPNAITIVSFVYDASETIVILTHGLEADCTPLEVVIQDSIVLTENKNNLTVLEVDDRFRMWIGDRYLVGKILSVPIDFAVDIDDDTKIELFINN